MQVEAASSWEHLVKSSTRLFFKDVQGSPAGVADSLIRCINIPQMSLSWRWKRQRADYFSKSRAESKEKKKREAKEWNENRPSQQNSTSVPVRSNKACLTFSYILSPAE